MSTQKFMDSAGISYLWKKIAQAIDGGDEAVKEALEGLINNKITLLPYKDFGVIRADLTMPTIDIGELKPYQLTRAISKTVYIELPSGGRYIEAHFVIDNNSSTSRGGSVIDIQSGGGEINRGMGNHTIRGFYLRIE